jgi:hypothetical protein
MGSRGAAPAMGASTMDVIAYFEHELEVADRELTALGERRRALMDVRRHSKFESVGGDADAAAGLAEPLDQRIVAADGAILEWQHRRGVLAEFQRIAGQYKRLHGVEGVSSLDVLEYARAEGGEAPAVVQRLIELLERSDRSEVIGRG